MSMRGVRATGARTITSALHGVLREDGRSRQEFFSLARTAA
jgi:GTP cyclohydrolase I